MSNKRLCALLISLFTFCAISSGQTWRSLQPCTIEAALPQAGPAENEFRFIAVGDTGNGCSNNDEGSPCKLVDQMALMHDQVKFSHVFLLGDNVYWSGRPKSFFEKLYRPFVPLAKKGVMIKGVIGNHDAMSKKGAQIQMKLFRAEDQSYFFDGNPANDPSPDAADPPLPTYDNYSVKTGLVEFFALDSSMLTGDCCKPFFWRENYKAGDAERQIGWLIEKLGASKARWKVVLLHHPPYSSGKQHGSQIRPDGTPEPQKEMERVRAVLAKASSDSKTRIHLVLAGHEHFYERIETNDGTRYFISGSGSKKRTNDLDGRLPSYHGCGETQRNTFMLFAAKHDALEYWTLTGAYTVIDHGFVD